MRSFNKKKSIDLSIDPTTSQQDQVSSSSVTHQNVEEKGSYENRADQKKEFFNNSDVNEEQPTTEIEDSKRRFLGEKKNKNLTEYRGEDDAFATSCDKFTIAEGALEGDEWEPVSSSIEARSNSYSSELHASTVLSGLINLRKTKVTRGKLQMDVWQRRKLLFVVIFVRKLRIKHDERQSKKDVK